MVEGYWSSSSPNDFYWWSTDFTLDRMVSGFFDYRLTTTFVPVAATVAEFMGRRCLKVTIPANVLGNGVAFSGRLRAVRDDAIIETSETVTMRLQR